jgi:O-antigen/teichoic acid export membrane protein
MFRNILGTIGIRAINALLTLFIIVLNARCLGAEGVGTISLIILAVTIIQLLTNLIGGSAVIYMTPRVGVYRLLLPAYMWSILISFAGAFSMELIGQLIPSVEIIPNGYLMEVLVLTLVVSLTSVHFMLILGLEKISTFNWVNLIQITALILILIVFYFINDYRNVMAYFWAYFISYLLTYLITLIRLIPHVKPVPLNGLSKIIKDLLRFGTYVQVANIFQQLNYRLSYYLVDFFSGRAAVGILSVGVQVSEGLWLIGRSIAIVQLSRISNEKDDKYSIRISLVLMKITWTITLLALIILLLVPSFAFQMLFGKVFAGIHPLVFSLGFGIVSLSASMILSQFFSGVNKPFHNTISSAIGIVITVGCGLLLIPDLGVIGAGITATLSYTFATLYQIIIFIRITHTEFRELLFTGDDFMQIRKEIQLLIKSPIQILTKKQ